MTFIFSCINSSSAVFIYKLFIYKSNSYTPD